MSAAPTALVVDDDRDVLTAARLALRADFAEVLTTDDPQSIPGLMAEGPIDVFLLDMNFAIGSNSGAEGLAWLKRILAADADAVVVLMTAFGDLNTAVQAMREGAADFVLKPWQNDRLLATMSVAASLRRSRVSLRALAAPEPQYGMIAGSAPMREILRKVARAAPTDANVLIGGENGTGKELIARELHRQSGRAAQPFVAVDLGAVPETLFESELFGHIKGAFTGAEADRDGRFCAAHGGTLFLDEIANLPLASQGKLLRAIEGREITPLGSSRARPVDVRLLAASNQSLADLIAKGRFREDLYYRINTIELELPPLRERLDDLPALVEFFSARCRRKYRTGDRAFTAAAMDAMRRHRWPGNVRELSHAVERALILGDGPEVDVDELGLVSPAREQAPPDLDLEANERRLVERAIFRHEGNVSRAAAALGITRAALYRRIEKFGL